MGFILRMTLLQILHHPDSRLRTKATEIRQFPPEIATLAKDMLETMYAAPGIGLAATQVNVHKRLIVIDVSEDNSSPLVLINPKLKLIGENIPWEEGCLSVPGIYETVQRSEHIEVLAQDINGDEFAMQASGLLSVCIQHECDHLDGKLFVDYLSSLKRSRINKKIKNEKENA
jgi:peptide deformylase